MGERRGHSDPDVHPRMKLDRLELLQITAFSDGQEAIHISRAGVGRSLALEARATNPFHSRYTLPLRQGGDGRMPLSLEGGWDDGGIRP